MYFWVGQFYVAVEKKEPFELYLWLYTGHLFF